MKGLIRAFFMCYSMFTALPCPYRPWDEAARENMLLCLPLVGLLIGGLWSLASLLSMRWLPAVCAAVIVAFPWLATGFIHLDGYMDTCDAILSWRPLEKRLQILKDTHSGAFSVIALAVLALFGYDAAAHLSGYAFIRVLVLIPAVSRCGSAFSMLALRPLGHSEYAGMDRRIAKVWPIIAMWLILMAAGFFWLDRYVLVLLAESIAYAISITWACRVMKGVSGDLAGFALTISECTALVTLSHMGFSG